MKIKTIIFGIFVLLGVGLLPAQTIDVHFPSYAGISYTFSLSLGEKQDTILSDQLDAQGKTQIQIPKQYKDYVGVSQFRLENGTGLNLILNQESHIKVGIISGKHSELAFHGSPENTDLSIKYNEHQSLRQKGQAILVALESYTPKDNLYSILEKERMQLEKSYNTFMHKEQASSLYAAHLRRMQYFLGDVGNTLTQDQSERIEYFRHYFRKELDYQKAYTSGLWQSLLESWVMMHTKAVFSDSLLVADGKAILDRISDETLKKAWANQIITLFSHHNKEILLTKLGIGNLISEGTRAPYLRMPPFTRIPINAVIVFYESGCPGCEIEIEQMQQNHSIIYESGYRVFSISADMDSTVYNYHSQEFPWEGKYCDYKGFQGENFKNYGVFGTPTIFVVNAEGMIIGRYARVSEVLEKIMN